MWVIESFTERLPSSPASEVITLPRNWSIRRRSKSSRAHPPGSPSVSRSIPHKILNSSPESSRARAKSRHYPGNAGSNSFSLMGKPKEWRGATLCRLVTCWTKKTSIPEPTDADFALFQLVRGEVGSARLSPLAGSRLKAVRPRGERAKFLAQAAQGKARQAVGRHVCGLGLPRFLYANAVSHRADSEAGWRSNLLRSSPDKLRRSAFPLLEVPVHGCQR